jgi:H/ACA ribonucleoprotein complex subunit 4
MSRPPWEIKREVIVKDEEPTNLDFGCAPDKRSMQAHIKYGIINIDKPPGPTSHEVVAWVKRMLGLSHAGHSGTLEN